MAFLVKRGDTWYVKYKENGKLKWKSCKTTKKKIADEVLKEVQDREAKGYNRVFTGGTHGITLGEYTEIHLHAEKSEISPEWWKIKGLIFKAHILPYFGDDTPLEQIDTRKVELYRIERLKFVQPKTVNKEIAILTKLLRSAIHQKFIPSHCLPVLKRLKETRGRLRFLNQEEIVLLKEAAKAHSPEMETYTMLCLYAGLRSGEALHLRWSDVSIGRKTISIVSYEDVDNVTGATIKWIPKTNQHRTVPMLPDLYEYLCAREQSISGTQFVVRSHSRIGFDQLARHFIQVVKAAGLQTSGEDKVTAHTLRHTFASHLVMNRVPLYDVSKLLGHSSTAMTEIYAHLAPDYLHESVKGISY